MKHNQDSKHNHTFANFALPMMVNRNSNSCTCGSTCIRNQSFEQIQNNQYGKKTKCITCSGLICSWRLTQAARSQFHFNFSLFIFQCGNFVIFYFLGMGFFFFFKISDYFNEKKFYFMFTIKGHKSFQEITNNQTKNLREF